MILGVNPIKRFGIGYQKRKPFEHKKEPEHTLVLFCMLKPTRGEYG